MGMARPPLLRGELAPQGAIDLLRDLERRRLTGTLRFESEDASGELVLFGGEIAVEQPSRDDGRDPVDVLLELGAGSYEVQQRLPPLAVSKGTDFVRTGSLAVHVPADLMSYCEHAGLSGALVLEHEGHRAEAIYDAGELLAIQLDGEGESDLSAIFAWDEGRFRIELDPEIPASYREEEAPTTRLPVTPREGTPRREDTRQFLRVLELALVDVIDKSERARSPTRTSPPLPPPPKARPRPASLPPPPPSKRRDQQTVRLIYLSGDPPPPADAPSSTRHVGRGAAEPVLTDARPERRSVHVHSEPEAMAKKKKQGGKDRAEPSEREERASEEVEAAPREEDAPEPKSEPAAEPAAAAAPPRKADDEQPEQPADADAAGAPSPAAHPPGNPMLAVAWAIGVLLIGLLILGALARLPAIQ